MKLPPVIKRISETVGVIMVLVVAASGLASFFSEYMPVLAGEFNELVVMVDDNTVPRLLPIYDMYKRRVDKLSKKSELQNLTPDENNELYYAKVQKKAIRKKLIAAGYDPEPKKKSEN